MTAEPRRTGGAWSALIAGVAFGLALVLGAVALRPPGEAPVASQAGETAVAAPAAASETRALVLIHHRGQQFGRLDASASPCLSAFTRIMTRIGCSLVASYLALGRAQTGESDIAVKISFDRRCARAATAP